LWIIPLIAITALFETKGAPKVQEWWTRLLPFLSEPQGYSLGGYLGSAAGKAQMVGSWGVFVLLIVNALFNTFIGEELLFRGLLLPRMEGTFGAWAWVANGVLLGLYHIHQPWGIVGGIITGTLLFALPTKLFKSSWFGIVLHSGQSVFFAFILLGMVLGLA
jgi:membrane protease YdiL (CAAX protease family)